jgi:hypothetical protein
MDKEYKGYFVEEEHGTYYVYDEYDNLVHVSSTLQDLDDFCPGLGELQESLAKAKKKAFEKPVKWEHDEHLEEVCKYCRNLVGWDDDTVLTEEMLDKEDWKLRSVSVKKNTPLRKIRQALLQPKDSE